MSCQRRRRDDRPERHTSHVEYTRHWRLQYNSFCTFPLLWHVQRVASLLFLLPSPSMQSSTRVSIPESHTTRATTRLRIPPRPKVHVVPRCIPTPSDSWSSRLPMALFGAPRGTHKEGSQRVDRTVQPGVDRLQPLHRWSEGWTHTPLQVDWVQNAQRRRRTRGNRRVLCGSWCEPRPPWIDPRIRFVCPRSSAIPSKGALIEGSGSRSVHLSNPSSLPSIFGSEREETRPPREPPF